MLKEMPGGPLRGLRILEFQGLGPGPFCGMMFSDMGADVFQIVPPGNGRSPFNVVLGRGRSVLELDLKNPDSVEVCLALSARADAVIEGFRPGVMERLGLGPEEVLARNTRIVYGRVTGWGQYGPHAHAAGHDIVYLALSGALHAIGTPRKPLPPLNLIGDFGGGGAYVAIGVLAALLHARATGHGQVVDCAMTDGAISLMSMIYGLVAKDLWQDRRRSNLLDGGAPYYDTYCCADGKWVAIGALEQPFFQQLLEALDIPSEDFEDFEDRACWPALRKRLRDTFASKSRDRWCELLEGTDACFAPVLSLSEAKLHPQNVARKAFVDLDGVVQPAPAPRFSATPGEIRRRTTPDAAALDRWELPVSLIEKLHELTQRTT